MLRPLPFANADRVVMVNEHTPQFPLLSLSAENFRDLCDQAKSFQACGAFRNTTFNLSGATEPQRTLGKMMTANVLPLLGVAPVIGRSFTPAEDAPRRRSGRPPELRPLDVAIRRGPQRARSARPARRPTLRGDWRAAGVVSPVPDGRRLRADWGVHCEPTRGSRLAPGDSSHRAASRRCVARAGQRRGRLDCVASGARLSRDQHPRDDAGDARAGRARARASARPCSSSSRRSRACC